MLENLIFHPPYNPYTWQSSGIYDISDTESPIAAKIIGDFSRKCLIYCHGNCDSADTADFTLDRISNHRISIVIPEYEGFGLTHGKCSEAGMFRPVHRAYDLLTEDMGIDPADVFVLGYSLGTCPALELASCKEIGGLILQAPFYSGYEMSCHCIGKAKSLIVSPVAASIGLNYKYARKVTAKTLVFHGTDDSIVPYSQGKRIFDEIPAFNKRMITVRDSGHCTFQRQIGINKYARIVSKFINRKMW